MDNQLFTEILEAIKDSMKETKESIKEMQKDISGIKDSQHEMKEDIGVHIYRTNLLENELKIQKLDNKEEFDKVHAEIEPIQKHINYIKGGGALLGFLLTIVAILSYLKII